MLIVSSREFRNKQAMYLDQVDEGKEILVTRGKNKSYKIMPVTENDTIIPKKFILAPDERLEHAISAEELIHGIKQDLKEMFERKQI